MENEKLFQINLNDETSFREPKIEKHHIAYNKFAWVGNAALRAIREDQRLLVPLDSDTHRELHKAVSHVPPLSYHMARDTLREFADYEPNSYLHNVENLQWSIESAIRHPRADIIERELGALIVHTLELQKPFIDESLPTRLIKI